MTCYQSNFTPIEEWKTDQNSSGLKRAIHGQKDRPLSCDQQPIADLRSSKICKSLQKQTNLVEAMESVESVQAQDFKK